MTFNNESRNNNDSSSSITTTTVQAQAQVLPEIIKGDADWRSYHSIKLDNGVSCIFVHDKESKTTACSVAVGVGASYDPRELSGIAHFTEHMCFLGSEAYPEENEFKKYLASHGGRSNASTSMNQTVYKFDVLAEHAEKAVDIFSNFFISPLFTQSGTDRELNAVDSENSKNMSNDGRRRLQILKALADPNHHYSKFSTGDAQTLGGAGGDGKRRIIVSGEEEEEEEKEEKNEDCVSSQNTLVREVMLAFHRRHYRPDNLTVVIVGPQTLETLQEWIVKRFGTIRNRWEVHDDDDDNNNNETTMTMTEAEKLVHKSATEAPDDNYGAPQVPHNPPFHSKFHSNKWPILLTTLPLQSMRKMYIYFPLPSVVTLNDQSPYHILCHLLGHEGPGSIFAALHLDLIDSISVGPRLSEVDHSLLQINISLTEKGEKHWEEVVSTIFEYCYLLAEKVKTAKEGRQQGSEGEGGGESGEGSNEALDQLMCIWGEVQKIKSLRFHQTSPGQALGLAPFLASSVRRVGTRRSLSIGSLLEEGNDSLPLDHLFDFVTQLTPQNCFIEHCSKSAWEKRNTKKSEIDFDCDLFGLKKEKWYNVDYHLSPIDANIIKTWNREYLSKKQTSLFLPSENKYIPTDLSLCSELPEEATQHPRIDKKIEPPNLIINDKDFGRLWHRLDDRYCLPKASLTLLLRNPAVQHKRESQDSWIFESKHDIQSEILLQIFNDALAERTYSPHLAGLSWSLSKIPSGLVIKCSGYSQHLTTFAIDIVKQFFCKESSFITEKSVQTNKDKMIRYYESYLKSRRADTYASYYTNMLMSLRGFGVEDSLSLTKNLSLESIQRHHQYLTSLQAVKVECLVSGNISSKDAESFFLQTQSIMSEGNVGSEHGNEPGNRNVDNIHKWIPGPFERAMRQGEDVHLHFQSQNPEEQNGAVRMTFQSQTPGFKGIHDIKSSSMNESMIQTASLRVLCHILKEPLFNQLRTKEQLGYVVSSSYNVDFSSHQANGAATCGTIPIDSVVINVLSKKVPPPVITRRIDEFLVSFRQKLIEMSEVEIQSHTDALSKKLLKPIQKLHTEVDDHFSNIRRYSPECIDHNGNQLLQLTWNRKEQLSQAIKKLSRSELLHAFDAVIAGKTRSRVVSHVYGNKFSFQSTACIHNSSNEGTPGRKICHIQSISEIFQKRHMLPQYGRNIKGSLISGPHSFVNQLTKKGIFAIGVMAGAGIFLATAMSFSKGEKVDKMKIKK